MDVWGIDTGWYWKFQMSYIPWIHIYIYICVYIYSKQRKNCKTKFLWGCNGNRTNGYDVYFYVLIDVEKNGILAWPTSWIPLGSEGF